MQIPQPTFSSSDMVPDQRVIDDIIALDRSNMAPLLHWQGQQFDEAFVRRDISRNNPDLKNVVCCYDDDALQGYFRFSVDSLGHVLVRSLQLNKTAPKRTLLRLLARAYELLQTASLPEYTLIRAISNTFNTPSIRFQQKLGFHYDSGDACHCQYQTTMAELRKRLLQLNVHLFLFSVTADRKVA